MYYLKLLLINSNLSINNIHLLPRLNIFAQVCIQKNTTSMLITLLKMLS